MNQLGKSLQTRSGPDNPPGLGLVIPVVEESKFSPLTSGCLVYRFTCHDYSETPNALRNRASAREARREPNGDAVGRSG